MTSEAHKRNPPGSERWGKVNKLRRISAEEAEIIRTADIGAPKLYQEHEGEYFCEVDELNAWRATQADTQALGAQP